MSRRCKTAFALTAVLVCSSMLGCTVETPLAPKPQGGPATTTAADGSTLKAGAPTIVSPTNNALLTTQRPTLTIAAATGQYQTQTFQYEFELQTDTGSVVTRSTVNGLTFTVANDLAINATFQWRARATLNGSFGPYSSLGRFQTPRLITPTVSSTDNEWRDWFMQLVQLRGVGPNVSIEALGTLEPDLTAAQVLVQKTSAGTLRPRLYLPTGNPNNLYGRTVDLGDIGRPWQWIPRGSTTCEGVCK